MSSSLLDSRLAAAQSFLVQSPPGEINDVFTDLRVLVSDDSALERSILPALKEYNLSQFTVSQIDSDPRRAKPTKVIVTPVSASSTDPGQERHLNWRTSESFSFDHMTATASSPSPIPRPDQFDSATLSLLESIDKLFEKHVENHYHDGVSAVYPLSDQRYPSPPPPPPRAPAPSLPSSPPRPVAQEEEEEEDEEPTETKMEEGGGGKLGQGLPDDEQQSAETAAETSDVAHEVLGDNDEQPTTVNNEEEKGEEEPMDVGTPAAAAPAVDSEHLEPTEEEEEEEERPLKSSRLFGLYLVGNKYNPNNYWTGRWRSNYTLDHTSGHLTGTSQINIHYYEQGNVQFSTVLTCSTQLGSEPSPEQVVSSIKQTEQGFSKSLNETYGQMSEETFKGLRRALPKTRSKVDWNKAVGYKLGAELGGGAGSQ